VPAIQSQKSKEYQEQHPQTPFGEVTKELAQASNIMEQAAGFIPSEA